MGSRDIEEAELIGPFTIVYRRHLDRIARVAEVDETHAFDNAAIFHIETGNDPLGQHCQPNAFTAAA